MAPWRYADIADSAPRLIDGGSRIGPEPLVGDCLRVDPVKLEVGMPRTVLKFDETLQPTDLLEVGSPLTVQGQAPPVLSGVPAQGLALPVLRAQIHAPQVRKPVIQDLGVDLGRIGIVGFRHPSRSHQPPKMRPQHVDPAHLVLRGGLSDPPQVSGNPIRRAHWNPQTASAQTGHSDRVEPEYGSGRTTRPGRTAGQRRTEQPSPGSRRGGHQTGDMFQPERKVLRRGGQVQSVVRRWRRLAPAVHGLLAPPGNHDLIVTVEPHRDGIALRHPVGDKAVKRVRGALERDQAVV